MRVTYVAPRPPKRTGIADYAARTVGGLEELGVEVVWTELWRGERSDVVHFELSAGNRSALWQAARAAREGIPTTVTLHDPPGAAWWPLDPPVDTRRHVIRHALHLPLRSRLHAWEARLLGTVRATFVLSPRGARSVKETGYQRVVELPHVSFPCSDPGAARDPRALFFGFNYPGRGVGLVAALRDELCRVTGNFTLVVAGGGFATSRDEPHIERHGYVDEERLCELFHSCSVALLPYEDGSRYGAFDSTSGALHRAWSHGLPVVAFDVRAIGDEVRASAGGAVAPPGDVRAMAKAVASYWRDPDRAIADGLRGRAVADRSDPLAVGALMLQTWAQVAQ